MKRIGIDSFTIWIDLGIFTYFDSNLTRRVIELYEETGEVRDEHDRKPIFKEVNGVKYKAQILLPFGNRPILELTLNSRMLKNDFYQRQHIQTINDSNFRTVFDDVCKTIDLACDYYDFLDHSTIHDMDICWDYYANNSDFERTCTIISSTPWGSSFYISLDGNYMERAKKITGAQFSKRTGSSIKRPFLKHYTKYWEFIHKSFEFYQAYCPTFIDENYRRFEVQVKNARHFQWLEKRGCLPIGFTDGGVNLRSVLTLSEKHLEDCMNEITLQYAKPKKVDRPPTGINATDFILMKCISFLMKEGFTLEDCIEFLDEYSNIENTRVTAKSRIRRRMKRAFSDHYGLEHLLITDDDVLSVSNEKLGV